MLLTRLLLNLRKAVEQPGSTTETSGFLDTVAPLDKSTQLAFAHETVSDSDMEMSGISASSRILELDVLELSSTNSYEGDADRQRE